MERGLGTVRILCQWAISPYPGGLQRDALCTE